MASSRDTDIVHAILRNPRTARMIYAASAMFERPYSNFTQVKSDLRNLFDEGVLGRVEVPSDKNGRCEFLYHVKTGAKRLVPELKPFKAGNSIFKAPVTSPHTIFVAECISHLERSIGEYKSHIELLETRRDGRFTAKIALTTTNGTQITHLIPDGVFLVDINGTINLFFLELQNRVRAIDSVSKDSISKTFKEKLMKYKAFQLLIPPFRMHILAGNWRNVLTGYIRPVRGSL